MELLETLKALSDATRLSLVNILLEYDFCVGALAKHLNVSKPAVSQHLQVLRKANLVKGEKRGYYTHYCVNRELLKKMAHELIKLADKPPKLMEDCPSRANGRTSHPCCRKEGDGANE